MTATLLPNAKQQFIDSNGRPLAGGSVYFYIPNTSTLKNTWQDAGKTVLNTDPVVLDANGQAIIYGDGQYRQVVYDVHNNLIWDRLTDSPALNSEFQSFVSSVNGPSGSDVVGFNQGIAGSITITSQDMLRQFVSVLSFGLTGDGITDNSTAIATMLAGLGSSNYEVLIPKGNYLVGSNVTIPTNLALRFQDGARLLIPNGVTVTLTNVELLAGRQQIFQCTGTGKVVGTVRNDLIFPEWWGAIADGLHPPVGADFSDRAAAAARNAPALQAALTFAGYQYSINGLTGTVSLTYGYYVYDTTLSVPLSVNIVGYGIGSALFYYAATGNALECISTNNHLLKDFFIAPIAGPTWNYTSGYGLYMNGVSTPVVDNVWSSGFGGGTFYFLSVIEGRIRGCISDNSNGPAFIIRGVGQGTVLSNCVTAGTDGGACFDIQSGYDWHLIGCTAKDGGTGTNGFYLNAVENINMTACGCHDINHDGIVLTASTLNCTLTSCFVNGASTGSSGSYGAFNISGTRNKLIAPKVTQNTPTYSYALILGGGGVDCTYCEENFISGTAGIILDAQPTGSNVTKIRKVSTANATPVNIWAKSLNNNCGAILEATVLAKQQGASGATAMYKFVTYARTNTTNTALLSGPTSIYSYESDALLNATWVLTDSTANAGVVSLQITGLAAGGTIDWEAIVTSIAVTG
jgi:hypothetical protein